MGEDANVLCPRLESIYITTYTGEVVFIPLSDCLRRRKTAGFMLKHLKLLDVQGLMGHLNEFCEEFYPLAEAVEAGDSSPGGG